MKKTPMLLFLPRKPLKDGEWPPKPGNLHRLFLENGSEIPGIASVEAEIYPNEPMRVSIVFDAGSVEVVTVKRRPRRPQFK